MKKFIITLKEESELLESIITLLESNGIIEVEEVQSSKKQRVKGIGIIAIDEETGEEIEFDSIQQASRILEISHVDIKNHLDTRKNLQGYYFYRKHEKPLKLK